MLNLCRLLLNAEPQLLVSFIVTEEWLGLLGGSLPLPPNFSFRTIPNVIPSEIGRAKDFAGFYESVLTKMEAPVEQLFDRLQPPEPSVIIYDTYLNWVVAMGNRRNILVASFYTMSATVFSIFHHSNLILQNRHFRSDFSDPQQKEQLISYMPGVPPMKITDLPTPLHGQEVLPRALEAIKLLLKAQYLLFTSVYELESQVLDSLKEELPMKIYSLGLPIPSFNIETSIPEEKPDYMKWLDAHRRGSFLSVSNAQLDEIIGRVCDSGVRFLWVARWEVERFNGCGNGRVVPWCDQLKKEDDSLVTREEVARLVLRLMDFKSEEAKQRRRRAKEIREICTKASAGKGSSEIDILDFIRDFSRR
ncbi:7-deoxyloganetin glucosyltransferase [Handroanthus impetiginosus]|uniref:7-deoxyloganetin glucosyltransferase n=1 Tax=Handroanthus impetiginosus TaxID=429701 RepID=A0A2G9FWL1_9LAMI|nr:7-deoxyloganetin glucosyltransferase [Handroanthus impetiginosus]